MVSRFLRFPGGKSRAVTLSYDDGVVQDKKLMNIFDKYGLKATFNINDYIFTHDLEAYNLVAFKLNEIKENEEE